MKKLILPLVCILAIISTRCTKNIDEYYDEKALEKLDAISQKIGDLSSVSVLVVSAHDGMQTESDVYLKGSDKMHVIARNDETKKGYYFNGKEFTVFNFNLGEYQRVPAPPTTIQTIDSIHSKFGVHFPAADFFYPTLTDDMIAHFDTLMMLEDAVIDNENYAQILAANKNIDAIITIDKEQNVPYSLEIFDKQNGHSPTYAASFLMWRFNPELADDIFTFSPPANAKEATLISLKK